MGQALGADRHTRVRVRPGGDLVPVLVYQQSLGGCVPQSVLEAGMADDQRSIDVRHHELQLMYREFMVERHIDSACLQHAQDGDDRVEAPFDTDRNQLLRAHPRAIRWWASWFARASSSL